MFRTFFLKNNFGRKLKQQFQKETKNFGKKPKLKFQKEIKIVILEGDLKTNFGKKPKVLSGKQIFWNEIQTKISERNQN